jgi:serine/threonine protein kinase/tetratricopeptide (TPR) repeat protein
MMDGRLPDPQRWALLEPLLDELLELSPTGRRAWVDALRDRDAAMADQLDALLRAVSGAERDRFLTGSARRADAGGEAEDEAAESTLRGRRLGAYTLDAPLGHGGTGSVWRARRDDGRFEGEVAIKLLHLSLLGRVGAQRFRREGAILARLAHPHIARLLDAGIGDAGQPYMVLDLVVGERIDRHCDARRLGLEQRLTLFTEVLEAVAHAHRHLVIHRDLKPTNILVDAAGRVKLLDFGIAKLLEDEAGTAESTELTREGGRAMTPEYAAPEQLRGDPVTTATDVYALGVLLYQLLTGRHPTAPEGATMPQLMRATLENEPARASSAFQPVAGRSAADERAASRGSTPARLTRQLRGDLDNIVARALRKEPAQRYGSVVELAEDLRRYRCHEPVSARADSLAYRSARFVRRHRGAVVAGALGCAAVIAGLVGTLTQAHRAEAQAAQAQQERDSALHELAFAGAARDLLGFLVGQGNGQPMTATELLARSEQLVDQQYGADARTRGRLQLLLGIEYGNLLESARSMAVLERAQASARAAADPALLSNVDCLIAATLGDQDKPKRAMALFDSAIDRLKSPGSDEDSVLAACLQLRAALHAQLGHPQDMLADAQAARTALGAPRDDQRVLASSIGIQIAEAQGRLGQLAPAIAGYEASIAEMQRMGRQRTSRMAVRYNNLSRLLYTAGQPRRAHEAAQRGLAIVRDVADDNELGALIEANDSRALIELGRFDEAKALSEHALASAIERKDARWIGTFALYGAPAWCATGDLVRGASLLAVARDKLGATLPAAHPNLGALALADAQLALAQLRPEPARRQLQQAISIFVAAPERNPLQVRALALLARTEQGLGDAAGAAEHSSLAVAQARQMARDFAGSDWLADALLARAAIRQAQGDGAAAQAALREAQVQLHAALGDDAPAARAVLPPPA